MEVFLHQTILGTVCVLISRLFQVNSSVRGMILWPMFLFAALQFFLLSNDKRARTLPLVLLGASLICEVLWIVAASELLGGLGFMAWSAFLGALAGTILFKLWKKCMIGKKVERKQQ